MRPVRSSAPADVPPVRAGLNEHGSPALDSLEGLEQMYSLVAERRQRANVGVHYAVLDVSDRRPNRMISTAEVQHRKAIAEITRSPAMLKWFTAGFNRLPEISGTGSAVVC